MLNWWLYTGKTVITSDHALKLEFVPDWIAIVGSGYIGLEFSDVYTALGSEVGLPLYILKDLILTVLSSILTFLYLFLGYMMHTQIKKKCEGFASALLNLYQLGFSDLNNWEHRFEDCFKAFLKYSRQQHNPIWDLLFFFFFLGGEWTMIWNFLTSILMMLSI